MLHHQSYRITANGKNHKNIYLCSIYTLKYSTHAPHTSEVRTLHIFEGPTPGSAPHHVDPPLPLEMGTPMSSYFYHLDVTTSLRAGSDTAAKHCTTLHQRFCTSCFPACRILYYKVHVLNTPPPFLIFLFWSPYCQ